MATNLLVTGSHGGDDPHVESKHDALMHAAMLGDEALRAKLIDRYAAFERLIAEKIAERTDAVSADYLSQLILLASDGMIVQEALRNDNFDAAAFVHQSESYLRALRPAGRI